MHDGIHQAVPSLVDAIPRIIQIGLQRELSSLQPRRFGMLSKTGLLVNSRKEILIQRPIQVFFPALNSISTKANIFTANFEEYRKQWGTIPSTMQNKILEKHQDRTRKLSGNNERNPDASSDCVWDPSVDIKDDD